MITAIIGFASSALGVANKLLGLKHDNAEQKVGVDAQQLTDARVTIKETSDASKIQDGVARKSDTAVAAELRANYQRDA